MEKINDLISALEPDNQLTLEEIPDLDLYMDQVIQLFEKKFSSSKRNDDEKVLTKTMINNYAKGKLLFPIKNKKYSKEHLILISLIYQLKGVLSINDIKTVLDRINTRIHEEDFGIDPLYNSFLHLSGLNAARFTEDIKGCASEVKEEVAHMKEKDEDHMEHVLLIASLVNMSNLYRRAAERLVDEIGEGKEE